MSCFNALACMTAFVFFYSLAVRYSLTCLLLRNRQWTTGIDQQSICFVIEYLLRQWFLFLTCRLLYHSEEAACWAGWNLSLLAWSQSGVRCPGRSASDLHSRCPERHRWSGKNMCPDSHHTSPHKTGLREEKESPQHPAAFLSKFRFMVAFLKLLSNMLYLPSVLFHIK